MAPNGSGRTAARSSRHHGWSRSKAGVTRDTAVVPGPDGIMSGAGRWEASSVDTAHAVDRDLLDQEFLRGERLALVLVGDRPGGNVFAHEHLLRRGTGCHSIGVARRRSRLRPRPQPRKPPAAGRKMATGQAAVISGAVVDDVSGGTGRLAVAAAGRKRAAGTPARDIAGRARA